MTTLLTPVQEPTATVPEQTAPLPDVPSRPAPPAGPAVEPRLALTGSLRTADVAQLVPQLARIAATSTPVVEVDLSRVERLDLDAARLLLRASWRLGEPGRRMVLLHPRPQVLRVLRFVGAAHLVVR